MEDPGREGFLIFLDFFTPPKTDSAIPHTLVYAMIRRLYPQMKVKFLVKKLWSETITERVK